MPRIFGKGVKKEEGRTAVSPLFHSNQQHRDQPQQQEHHQ